MTYSLGVDLGTTFTAAAVCAPNGQPQMVSLGSSGYAIPSVLFLREDGSFLTGEAAEMRATSDPTRVARHFKRQLGDPGSRFIGGTPYSPQTLTAKLLTDVLETVTKRQGSNPASVVLTHPANWGPYRREVLEQAAAMAGVTAEIELISEPEAAARHYAMSERIEVGELIAVYDLGGGTFDAVVMRRTETGFAVEGQPHGVERLGGVDFDDVIWAFAAEAVDLDPSEMASSEDESVLAAGHALRASCVAAKQLLSADTSADIRIALPSLNRTVRLNRKEFENRIRPRLVETIQALEASMTSGGVEATDLSRILLVGGSSRIPIVSQLLAAHFGRPIAMDSDPKNTVALGAAHRGAAEGSTEPAASSTELATAPVIDLSSVPEPPQTLEPVIDLTDDPAPLSVPKRLVETTSTDQQTGLSAAAPLAPQRPVAPKPVEEHVEVVPEATEPEVVDERPPNELESLQAESRHRVSMPVGARKENPYEPINPNQIGELTETGNPSPMLMAVAGLLVVVIVAAVVWGLAFR